MRKAAARFGRALGGGIVGYFIGSTSMLAFAILVAAASHELIGHSVFFYGRRGMTIGAIVGAIAGAVRVARRSAAAVLVIPERPGEAGSWSTSASKRD